LAKKEYHTKAELLRWYAQMHGPKIMPKNITFGVDPLDPKNKFDHYNPTSDTVYVHRDIDRYAFDHELGHVFDQHVLTPEIRARLTEALGKKQPWFWGDMNHAPDQPGPDPVMENFADLYSRMVMKKGGYPKLRRLLWDAYNNKPKEG